ncbi:MAG: heavy-metal-associated domain-containing protein [Bacilli bacterium]|nr:heavy-metal-associated domain-containing protein [Bacilli bacterium]
MQKIIKVDGMKCDKCASRVKDCLEKIDNIEKVLVDLETKEVKIEYKEEFDIDLIKEKINDLGYLVR